MKCRTIKLKWAKVTINTCIIMSVVGNIKIIIWNSN